MSASGPDTGFAALPSVAADQMRLDDCGFEFHAHQSEFSDFYDADQVRARYYPEVSRVLKSLLGAEEVIVFDHNVRSSVRAARGEPGVREPVDQAHNDYTRGSGPLRKDAILATAGRENRPGTTDRISEYPYIPHFGRTASILQQYLQSCEFIESTFTQAGFALDRHELVESEVAGSWDEYVTKVGYRADSVLIQLSDEEFQAGMDSLQRYARLNPGAGPVIELIDFFALRPVESDGGDGWT